MPQENQVLRCYSCRVFQVHLVKKQKKWQCKLCNSKQSVQKVYGTGSGKDCRVHVMKLNELQFSGCSNSDYVINNVNKYEEEGKARNEASITQRMETESKWLAYADNVDEVSDEEKNGNDKMFENEYFNRNKKKLNQDYDNLKSEQSFDLTGKLKRKSNEVTVSENNNEKKQEEQFKRNDMPFYENCPVETGSKWSAYIDEEKCLPEEDDDKSEAVFINENEICQSWSSNKNLSDKDSFKAQELNQKNPENYPKHSQNGNIGMADTKVCDGGRGRKGNSKLLETLHDDDDLDEILNI